MLELQGERLYSLIDVDRIIKGLDIAYKAKVNPKDVRPENHKGHLFIDLGSART